MLPEDELDEDVEEEEPEEEPPPMGFWEPIPPPPPPEEEDLDPPDPPPPEPIGDLALEEGGVPGTCDCCIFMGEDSLSEPPERECEGEMLGLMLGFMRDPGGLPPWGLILFPLPTAPPPLPDPERPCLVMGEEPGLPTPIP